MNFNKGKRNFILPKYSLLVIATIMLITLFFHSFSLLTNPGDLKPLDLLIKPALAADDKTTDDGYYGLNTTANEAGLIKKGQEPAGVATILGTIIGAVLSLVGVVFLALMVYGGVLWMMARGESEQLKKAKEIITTAITGLIIVIAAYAITYFIMESLTPK